MLLLALTTGALGAVAYAVGTHGSMGGALWYWLVTAAACSVGMAVYLSPEGLILQPLLPLALLAVRHIESWCAQPSWPWLLILLGLVGTSPMIATSRRTWRWAALLGPRQPGAFIWAEWTSLPWWPRIRTRPAGLTHPISGATTCAAGWVFVSVTVSVTAPAHAVVLTFCGTIVLAAIVAHSNRRRPRLTALPRSRRHLAGMTIQRDLGDLGLLVVLLAAGCGVLRGLGLDAVSAGAAWGLAVSAVLFPLLLWLAGPPECGKWTRHDLPTAAAACVLVLAPIVGILATTLTGLSGVTPLMIAAITTVVIAVTQTLHVGAVHRYWRSSDLVR